MKKIAFLLMSVAVIALSSCSKEGEQGPAGPAGAQGPAGPQGDNADLTSNDLTILAADFGGGTYAEYTVNFIDQEVYENGMAVAYIQDTFGYWNNIPSQWHEITDFGFFYGPNADGVNVGIVGFSATGGITADYPVRVVTMKRADYDHLNEAGLLANYNEVVKYLNK